MNRHQEDGSTAKNSGETNELQANIQQLQAKKVGKSVKVQKGAGIGGFALGRMHNKRKGDGANPYL